MPEQHWRAWFDTIGGVDEETGEEWSEDVCFIELTIDGRGWRNHIPQDEPQWLAAMCYQLAMFAGVITELPHTRPLPASGA